MRSSTRAAFLGRGADPEECGDDEGQAEQRQDQRLPAPALQRLAKDRSASGERDRTAEAALRRSNRHLPVDDVPCISATKKAASANRPRPTPMSQICAPSVAAPPRIAVERTSAATSKTSPLRPSANCVVEQSSLRTAPSNVFSRPSGGRESRVVLLSMTIVRPGRQAARSRPARRRGAARCEVDALLMYVLSPKNQPPSSSTRRTWPLNARRRPAPRRRRGCRTHLLDDVAHRRRGEIVGRREERHDGARARVAAGPFQA